MDPFYILADPKRRKILQLLSLNKSMTPRDFKAHFKISAAAISQHLKVLKESYFVHASSMGNRRIYRLNAHTLAKAGHLITTIIKQWERQNGPLKSIWKDAKIQL